MIRPRHSPHWNLLPQLPTRVFLTFPGVPASRDGPQGGGSEEERAALGPSVRRHGYTHTRVTWVVPGGVGRQGSRHSALNGAEELQSCCHAGPGA